MKKLLMCFLLIVWGSVGGDGYSALLASNAKSASIKDVYLSHQDSKNGEYGLTIKVSFNIEGCLNEDCDILALFYNGLNGAQLPKRSSGHTYDRQWLCTFKDFTPPYESTGYTKMELFIPYSAFELSNNAYVLQFELLIRDKTHVLFKSNRYSFDFVKLDVPCGSCGGTGICFLCHGFGGWNGGTRSSGYYRVPCNSCGGRTTCSYCGGKKYLSSSKSMDASKSDTNYSDTPIPPSYNSNGSGRTKVITSRKRCTVCTNGRVKTPISTWTEVNAKKCDECGEFMRYSGHIHQVCSVCYGQGYLETNEVVVE